MIRIQAVCECSRGRIRSKNEDNFYFDTKTLEMKNKGFKGQLCDYSEHIGPVTYCVFDGMGGEEAGEVAAYTACRRTAEYIESDSLDREDKISELYDSVNREIYNQSVEMGDIVMGTTCAGITFFDDTVTIFNIGDSGVFLFRNSLLSKLSTDHVEAYAEDGRKARLTKNLGMDPECSDVTPSVSVLKSIPGDIYLVCSDGLTDMVTENVISTILGESESIFVACSSLMKASFDGGGRDNITIILCKVE